MTYLLLFLLAVVFFELFGWLKMGKDAMAIIMRSQESMRVLASSELGDDEKESLVRRGSADIFKSTLLFATKCLVTGIVLYLLFLLIVALFPSLEPALLHDLVSPLAMLVLTAAIVCYAWVRKVIRARL